MSTLQYAVSGNCRVFARAVAARDVTGAMGNLADPKADPTMVPAYMYAGLWIIFLLPFAAIVW